MRAVGSAVVATSSASTRRLPAPRPRGGPRRAGPSAALGAEAGTTAAIALSGCADTGVAGGRAAQLESANPRAATEKRDMAPTLGTTPDQGQKSGGAPRSARVQETHDVSGELFRPLFVRRVPGVDELEPRAADL